MKYTLENNQSPWLENLYLDIFGYKTTGFFVELGVGHCIGVGSNTASLADLGWSGIYVEPHPKYFKECLDRHKNNNVIVVNCAAGDTYSKQNLMMGDTLREEVKQNFDRLNFIYADNYDPIQVEIRPTNDILKQFSCPKYFDLLSVDVEGYEKIIFDSFNFYDFKPKLIIVELRTNDMRFDKKFRDESQQVEDKLIYSGYRKIYEDILNTCFILQ